MATNKFFNRLKRHGEQDTHNLILRRYFFDRGFDVYYIPRSILEENYIFGESELSVFKKAILIEAIIPDFGDLDNEPIMNGFGMTFMASKSIQIHRDRFREEIVKHGLDPDVYVEPLAGDLFYIGNGDKTFLNSLFEVKNISEPIKFQFGKQFIFEVNLNTFRYNYEDFDVGVEHIDKVMQEFSNENNLSTAINDAVKFDVPDIINIDINDPLKNTLE